MSHPAACRNPDTCTLSYVQHLRGFVIGADALVTRGVHRTAPKETEHGVLETPDEPAWQTNARERRWDRDISAYLRLKKQGYNPPRVDGSRAREVYAETEDHINNDLSGKAGIAGGMDVKIDYSDGSDNFPSKD